MSQKIYKSAQGKVVDMGTLMLQNESVRAVGNMGVNARGDVLDSTNRVIDPKPSQVRRQYNKTTTNVAATPVATSTRTAKSNTTNLPDVDLNTVLETLDMAPEVSDADIVTQPVPVPETSVPRGGLAAAIARSQTIKQELELTARQRAQQAKLKKI
jgi:hypothetical protein